jgi:hypothetical protein
MRIFTFLLLLFSLSSIAQSPLPGIVKDSKDGTPLPFATLIPEHGKAIITDIDGQFVLEAIENSGYFTVTYTGYQPRQIQIRPGKKYYSVTLEAHTEELGEVVIKGENAANRIIREAIARKALNDPQQQLNSFRYNAYDRLVVTANPDSISGKLDSIFIYEKAGRRFQKIDSANFKFRKIIEKQHLYQTEKVSEYKFNKQQGLKETVLATRMAGFKQPVYEFIGLKLQSYSVYTKNIDIFETKYDGPVSDDALAEYNYRILDTLAIEDRQVYVVSFRPKTRRKRAMQGALYIDSKTYGVAKAVFRVKNVLDITSIHSFRYEQEYGIWFPDKKVLKIVKGNNKEDIKILGETIKFDAVEKHNRNRKKEASDFVYLSYESDIFDTAFNTPITIKRPDVAIEIEDAAIRRPQEYWDKFRRNSFDSRSMQTYAVLDSLVASDNWEERIILGRRIINGYLPLGPVELDLRSIFRFNNYEGFRLGAGGITSDAFSEIFRISGYAAYGTKDGEFKYSLGAAIRAGKFSNSWIGASYTDDVREIGSTTFAVDKRAFKIYEARPINLTTFYNYKTWLGYIDTKIIPKTETTWQLSHSQIDPKFNYIYTAGSQAYSPFEITTATASIQWNPFSDFMQTPAGRIEVEKRFPKFTFQYMQSVSGLLDSDFTFGKFDFRTEYEKKYLNGQKTSLLVQTGIAMGDTPLTHLYSTSPNNLDKEKILGRITLAGKNSFETMYFNEFFSSHYVIGQLKHGFRKFNIISKINMAPVLVTRAAWGNMEKPEQHQGIEYNTLKKGYYESGLELNEIYRGFGLSAFYRYGPYHLPKFDRNISIKFSFILNLGF